MNQLGSDSHFLDRTIVDEFPECIKLVDRSGRLLSMNPAGLRIIEADSAEQLIGQSVYSLIAPEDREEYVLLNQRVCDGNCETHVVRIVGLKGRQRIVETHGVQFLHGGENVALYVTRDITDQIQLEKEARESRELNRQIVDSAGFGVIVVNSEMRYVAFNPFMEQLSGKREADVLGLRPWEVFPFLEKMGVESMIRRTLEGETVVMPDHLSPSAKGGKRWLSIVHYPLRDGRSAIIGAIVFVHDNHQRKLAEDSLKISNQQLNHLSRRLLKVQENERRHLARELHDDIGQILTAIKLTMNQTLSHPDVAIQGRIGAGLEMLDEAVSRVRRMATQLRPPQLDELGLVASLHGLVAQHSKAAGFRGVVIAESLDLNLHPDAAIVCFRIAQEAISNASRHATPKNITLKISADADWVSLTIEDDGLGFNVEEIMKESVAAQGMGLLSMHERAHLVGGNVEVRSTPGSGTVIRVRIPLNASNAD